MDNALQQADRDFFVEWLYLITGQSHWFWQKHNDQELESLYEKNIAAHGDMEFDG